MASAQTAETFAKQHSYQLVKSCACHQREFAALRDGRPISKHRMPLALNCVQNLLAATAEEFNVDRQLTTDFTDQRKATLKPLARSVYFKSHHLAQLFSVFAVANVVCADAVPLKVLKRQIDSSFGKIGAHVLPEIRQLQGCAGEIGELLTFGVSISAQIQHKVTNWIRRIAAVSQQVLERLISRRGLVLAKGGQQIGKFVLRNIELAYRSS